MTATPASLFVRSVVFSCSWLQLASTFCDEWDPSVELFAQTKHIRSKFLPVVVVVSGQRGQEARPISAHSE